MNIEFARDFQVGQKAWIGLLLTPVQEDKGCGVQGFNCVELSSINKATCGHEVDGQFEIGWQSTKKLASHVSFLYSKINFFYPLFFLMVGQL